MRDGEALLRVDRAEALPGHWDALASSAFQRRAFLAHCERENPCAQRYWLLSRQGHPAAGAIVYTLPIDLLTFLSVRSPLAMQVVGVPCSVAASGILGPPEARRALLWALPGRERGFLLALNLEPEEIPAAPGRSPFAAGRTWPDVVLENRFGSMEEYARALRAPYRRRLERIARMEARYAIESGPCARFDAEMHRAYLAVLARSHGKLERLSEGFFRNLPDAFQLTTFRRGRELRGFVVTLADGDRFWFFLGGQVHDGTEDPRDLYHLKLLAVLRQGLASGARVIHLGQSAEIPKMRLGGSCREKLMLGWHHRPLVRRLLGLGAPMLSYRRRHSPAHVFREARA